MGWRGFSKVLWRSRSLTHGGPEWPVSLRNALGDLERLIRARPELESPGRALAKVIEVAFGEPALALLPPFDEGAGESHQLRVIQEAWNDGRPALDAVILALDGGVLARRTSMVARALSAGRSDPGDVLRSIAERDPERVVDWIKLSLGSANDTDEFERVIHGVGLEPSLVESVLRLVLLPGLADWSRRVSLELGDGMWPKGHCPICGCRPALAESRGLEQRRRLRCDRCAADWPGEHSRCPFCDQSDHRALRYAFVEGERDKYRLSICDRCGGRIKVVATLAPLTPPGLLVAELASIHLDLIDPPRPSAADSAENSADDL